MGAEAKLYLQQHLIPQLFEGLMTGLMYHRPSEPLDYLERALAEVRATGAPFAWDMLVKDDDLAAAGDIPFTKPLSRSGRQRTTTSRGNTRTGSQGRNGTGGKLPPSRVPSVVRAADVAKIPDVPVVLFMGGPGGGKTRHASKVQTALADLGLVHICMPDVIRNALSKYKDKYAEWHEAAEQYARGELINNGLALTLVKAEMGRYPNASAFFLEGYPREPRQVEDFERVVHSVNMALILDYDESTLRSHMERRGIEPDVIERRINEFRQKTLPSAKYFDDHKLLHLIPGEKSDAEVFERMRALVERAITVGVTVNSRQETTNNNNNVGSNNNNNNNNAEEEEQVQKAAEQQQQQEEGVIGGLSVKTEGVSAIEAPPPAAEEVSAIEAPPPAAEEVSAIEAPPPVIEEVSTIEAPPPAAEENASKVEEVAAPVEAMGTLEKVEDIVQSTTAVETSPPNLDPVVQGEIETAAPQPADDESREVEALAGDEAEHPSNLPANPSTLDVIEEPPPGVRDGEFGEAEDGGGASNGIISPTKDPVPDNQSQVGPSTTTTPEPPVPRGLPNNAPVVLIVGAPGSNKLEIARRIAAKYDGFILLSMGEMLRSGIAQASQENETLWSRVAAKMAAGERAPTKLCRQLLYNALHERGARAWGYVVEGYPRTPEQAKDWLATAERLDVAVLVDCTESYCAEQLRQRAIGTNARPDDISSAAVARRLQLFKADTLPMLKSLDEERRLRVVEGDTDAERIFQDVVHTIDHTLFIEDNGSGKSLEDTLPSRTTATNDDAANVDAK